MLAQLIGLLTAFAGALSIGYGAWLIYPPAAYIVGGAMLIYVAYSLSPAPSKPQ